MGYEHFQKLCDEHGVKPAEVSRATGVSTATLSSWKNGKYVPKKDKLEALAEYFKVPLDVISPGKEVSKKKTIIHAYHMDTPERIQKELEEKFKKMMTENFTGNSDLRISKKIPVLGRVAAGLPIIAEEEILDFEEISGEMALNGEYFALRIQGDSMEPRMESGDVVIVRQQEDADSGDYVIALVNGDDAVCKN